MIGRSGPIRTGMSPFDGITGLEPAALPLCYAPSFPVRAERFELSPKHVLSMPPLPAWATRASDARGGSRTRTETLFERATSAVWVTRARLHYRYGRRDSNPQKPPSEDGASAICATPACDAGGGIRTLTGLVLPTALSTPRVCHLRHTSEHFSRPTPGEGVEPP